MFRYMYVIQNIINGNSFSGFVDYVYRCFDASDAKNITNSFFGLLNKKYKTDNIGFLTKDHHVATRAHIEGFSVEWEGVVDDRALCL